MRLFLQREKKFGGAIDLGVLSYMFDVLNRIQLFESANSRKIQIKELQEEGNSIIHEEEIEGDITGYKLLYCYISVK